MAVVLGLKYFQNVMNWGLHFQRTPNFSYLFFAFQLTMEIGLTLTCMHLWVFFKTYQIPPDLGIQVFYWVLLSEPRISLPYSVIGKMMLSNI